MDAILTWGGIGPSWIGEPTSTEKSDDAETSDD